MTRTYEKDDRPVISAKSTSPNFQARPFAPPQSAVSQVNQTAEGQSIQAKSLLSESLLGKGIFTPRPESSGRSVQRQVLFSRRTPVQAKLNIGAPDDKYEKEADSIAAKVVQQINSSPQKKSVPTQEGKEDSLQRSPKISKLQRRSSVEEEDEELQRSPLVQRREKISGGEASEDLESSIQSARGGGQSLDSNLQVKMGQAMGADFSRVKVHTDDRSDQLNKSIQAKAFTTGQDVFFRQGAYQPSSRGGQELIAHELTHVVQQNAIQQTMPISRSSRYIQRLISGEKLAEDVGVPKWDILFIRMSERYKTLIAKLDAYQERGLSHSVSQDSKKRVFQAGVLSNGLKEIDAAAKDYIVEHQADNDDRVNRIISLQKNEIPEEDKIVNEVASDSTWDDPNLAQTWGDAIALRRTGVKPRPGLKAGDFTDTNLKAPLTPLGSGAVNTVFSATYKETSKKGRITTPTFGGVYKTELHKDQTDPEKDSKIPDKDRNYSARNVAMSRLNELLGLDVIPRTEFAINEGYFGTVMGKVENGEHALKEIDVEVPYQQKPTMPTTPLDKQNPTQEWLQYDMDRLKRTKWEQADGTIDMRNDKLNPLDDQNYKQSGSPRYRSDDPNDNTIIKHEDASTEVNYDDPNLMKGLSNLQLIDAIAGSSDRHISNYMLVRGKKGKVKDVKGIDNDFSFGDTTIDELKGKPGRKNLGIPAIVDKDVAERIIQIDPAKVKAILEPLLEAKEVTAAVKRFQDVVVALTKLKQNNQLIKNWHDPSLPTQMSDPSTSYVGRDKEIVQNLEAKGLIAKKKS